MNYKVFCDFDGTISKQDVVDAFLEKFANSKWIEIESLWIQGKIGSQECLKRQIECVEGIAIDDLNRFLESIQIDSSFQEFVCFLENRRIPLQIVSDGCDLFIKKIMENHGINHIEIYSNHLEENLQISFPYVQISCKTLSGICKCKIVREAEVSIYIGDGRSDFCVSENVDILFAKSGLADHCTSKQIPFYRFETFNDVMAILEKIFEIKQAI